jgi:hypothetical protein
MDVKRSAEREFESLFQLFDNDRHRKPMSDEDEEIESKSEEVGDEKHGTTETTAETVQRDGREAIGG